MQRLILKEYYDKDKKPIEINIKKFKKKIKWYGNNIYYILKDTFIFIRIHKMNEDVTEIIELSEDISSKDICFIQSHWAGGE